MREISPELNQIESKDEERESLRPQGLNDFVGQAKVCQKLHLFVQAAQQRNDALDHVLLAGPPGLGKTTLSHILAREMRSQSHVVTGPNVEKKGDLAAILSNLGEKDVLFVDEIHRLPRAIEEVLYSAMEDFQLDIIIGQGPAARTLRIDLPRFTLVGATTRTGLLTGPLRDRFGVQMRLDFYPDTELEQVLLRSAKLLQITLDPSGAKEVARRSRGTPRIANRLLKRVRDYAQVTTKSLKPKITETMAKEALALLEIDSKGLDSLDRKFLLMLMDHFDGGPVGIESLAAAIGEERHTLEDVYEPYLIQQGFLQRTPRGRAATKLAYHHLDRVWENTQVDTPSVD